MKEILADEGKGTTASGSEKKPAGEEKKETSKFKGNYGKIILIILLVTGFAYFAAYALGFHGWLGPVNALLDKNVGFLIFIFLVLLSTLIFDKSVKIDSIFPWVKYTCTLIAIIVFIIATPWKSPTSNIPFIGRNNVKQSEKIVFNSSPGLKVTKIGDNAYDVVFLKNEPMVLINVVNKGTKYIFGGAPYGVLKWQDLKRPEKYLPVPMGVTITELDGHPMILQCQKWRKITITFIKKT